jgi:hypothetical protein
MCARARVVTGHPTGTNPVGVEIPILDGDVQHDANAEIRATLSLTTDGHDAWPVTATGMLTPYGAEVFVERGVVLGNGVREWVSQGYFRVNDVDQDRVPDGPIRVTGQDRMSGIKDGRLVAPVYFGPGSSVALVFETLVGEVYPTATILYDFNAVVTTFDTGHVAEEDRFGFLLDIARAHGKVMFWDHEGRLRVESAPNPGNPVWTVSAGAGGVLVSMSRSLSRQGVYNGVVAHGEAPGEGDPVRSVALNLNPASPTFWYGAFGKVPRFYSSPFITTQAQADSAAQAMLLRELGLVYSVDMSTIPNPALEVLDPVLIDHVDGAETHVVERLTVPLTARAAMTATTRDQTVVVIGSGS